MIKAHEVASEWELELGEAQITEAALSRALRIVITSEEADSLTVSIATPFTVTLAASSTIVHLDPERDDPKLGGLIVSLRGSGVEEISVLSNRTLRVICEVASIEVPPDRDYEAWDLESESFKLVAVPGDEVAVWLR